MKIEKFTLFSEYITLLYNIINIHMNTYACICEHILRIPWKIIRKLKIASHFFKVAEKKVSLDKGNIIQTSR